MKIWILLCCLLFIGYPVHLQKLVINQIKPIAKSYDWKGPNQNCRYLCQKLGGKICGTNFFDCCKAQDCKNVFKFQVCVKPIQGYTCNIVKRAGSLFQQLKNELSEYDN